MRVSSSLAGQWALRVDSDGTSPLPAEAAALVGRAFPAVVPGAIHRDLEEAGVIPDPLFDRNEDAVAWVGRTDWLLERDFGAVPAAERADLVFDGIDTVASIVLNGQAVARSRNMHRTYRYDVTTMLREANSLAVHLTSALAEAEEWERRLGPRPNDYPLPYNYIRKMACSFGWDWGPTVVSAGIWRGVRVESWSTARIAAVRPLVDVVDGTGLLSAHIEVERAASCVGSELIVELEIAGQTVRHVIDPGEDAVVVEARVPEVARWSPRGFGEPRLYPLRVRLMAVGVELDVHETRVGFRAVTVRRESDEFGTSFVLEVNGEPVFVKGVNWIPDSIHPGTVTRREYRVRLEQACEANVNLVRVWGGGVYESDEFYDICDELGLLVWQDFLFACASYPEEEPFRAEVLAEAQDNISRLSSHPSLVIWNGNNECLWMHEHLDWPNRAGGESSWGDAFYLAWLPELLAEIDPSRPYTEGSPWSGGEGRAPNDPRHQTFHSWDVWNAEDYVHYRDSVPRFVSEFGWQGAAAWRTLRDAVADDPLRIDSPGIQHHQKATDGHAKLMRGLAAHFAPTDSFDQWHRQTQWVQAAALQAGILHWRSNWPRTSGTIVWQLNDLWPVISWSIVDGAGRLKPSYFALREAYRERVLAWAPQEHGFVLCAINDTDEQWEGSAVLRRMRLDGEVVAGGCLEITAGPRSVQRVPVPAALSRAADPDAELLVAELGDARAIWFLADPREAAAELGESDAAGLTIRVDAVPGGLDVVVASGRVVRDVLVQADRIHPRARVDRGFTTILPGDAVTFRIRADVALDPRAIEGHFVVTWAGIPEACG
ncbi:MAG: glycoside hydrolase family 2 protein [Microbacterium sp.]